MHDISGDNDIHHLPLISIDPFTGPQMDVRICRSTETGEGRGDILIISGHHAAVDAHGLFQAAALCADAYRRVCAGKPPVFQGPSWDPRGTDAISAQFFAEERNAAYERDAASADNGSFPFRDGPCGLPVRDSSTIQADEVTRLRAAGKAAGVTLDDQIMAAGFCALVQVGGDAYTTAPGLGISGAMDLRWYLPLQPSRSICNLSVAYDLSLSSSCCQEMSTALPAVSQAMRDSKEGNVGLGSMVAYERLYAGGVRAVKAYTNGLEKKYRLTGEKNPLLRNVGTIPSPATAFQHGEDGVPLQVTKAYLASGEMYPPGIGIYLSTYRGEMTVSVPFCGDAHGSQKIRLFHEAMRGYLLQDLSLP